MIAGQFIWGRFPFAEGDGRAKVRPALILSVASTNGHKVFLCAGLYSATEKVRGAVEVCLTPEECQLIGLGHQDSVLRFSRQQIQALMDRDVCSSIGSVSDLPCEKQASIFRAAKSIGCIN